MWAGIKWAGGSGREMGVEGQARSGRAVWRFLAAAATGHQCALVVLGLYYSCYKWCRLYFIVWSGCKWTPLQ